jgi:hypothetical protein
MKGIIGCIYAYIYIRIYASVCVCVCVCVCVWHLLLEITSILVETIIPKQIFIDFMQNQDPK